MRITMKDSLASRGRDAAPIVGKPLKVGNNTFEYQVEGGDRVIRLHNTDIIVKMPDGRIKLDTGGWRTVTTKARMNDLTPYQIRSDRGVWYVQGNVGGEVRKTPYYDGMVLPDAFGNPGPGEDKAKEELKLKDAIKKFLAKTIKAGVELPKPDNGDCWDCLMFDAEQPVGERQFSGYVSDPPLTDRDRKRSTDHLLSHIEEGYMHGSLIVNAFRGMGYKDLGIRLIVYGPNPDYTRIRRVIYSYLTRRLGLASC